jgi:hypothetical protein
MILVGHLTCIEKMTNGYILFEKPEEKKPPNLSIDGKIILK